MTDAVQDAYGRRAAEYTELLGTMETVHPADRQLVETWSGGVAGPVLDVGCGPGHWTDHLHRRGVDCWGVDLSPAFIDIARSLFPHLDLRVGDVDALPAADASLGGVLCWYSLVHREPESMPRALEEIARVLCAGGSLLLGFFEGPEVTAFDHAVISAFTWPMGELSRLLQAAGFDIMETHSRNAPPQRPHGAVVARRRAECRTG